MESIYRCAICFYYCCDIDRSVCISDHWIWESTREISHCIKERHSAACTDQRLYSTNEKYFFYYSNHFMVNFHLHKGFFFFSVHRLPQMTSLFVWESNNTSQLWTLLNEKHRYMCLFCTALKNGHKIEKLSLTSIPLT